MRRQRRNTGVVHESGVAHGQRAACAPQPARACHTSTRPPPPSIRSYLPRQPPPRRTCIQAPMESRAPPPGGPAASAVQAPRCAPQARFAPTAAAHPGGLPKRALSAKGGMAFMVQLCCLQVSPCGRGMVRQQHADLRTAPEARKGTGRGRRACGQSTVAS